MPTVQLPTGEELLADDETGTAAHTPGALIQRVHDTAAVAAIEALEAALAGVGGGGPTGGSTEATLLEVRDRLTPAGGTIAAALGVAPVAWDTSSATYTRIVNGTADSQGTNTVLSTVARLWSGTGFDRPRTVGGLTAASESEVGVQAVGLTAWDGATAQRRIRAMGGVADGNSGNALLGAGLGLFNGSGYDRARSVPDGTFTVRGAVGWLGAAHMLADGSAFRAQAGANLADGTSNSAYAAAVGMYLGDGTAGGLQKARTAEAAQGTAGAGLLGVGALLFDGTNWQRPRTAASRGDADTGGSATPAYGWLYNGASWDRMRGDVANGLDVDVTRLPLPPGAATEATLAAMAAAVPALEAGRQPVSVRWSPDLEVASGALASAGATVGGALGRIGTIAVEVTAGFTGTLAFEVSLDGGTTYRGLTMALATGTSVVGVTTANPATGQVWEGALPPGATHFRARAAAWTAGAGSARVIASAVAYEPAPTVSIAGGTVTAGSMGGFAGKTQVIQTAAQLVELTVANLAIGGVYTGASSDAHATAPGSMGSSGWTGGTVTVIALSDVDGDVDVEVSRDGTQWLKYRSAATAQAVPGQPAQGYVAELEFRPPLRYYRLVYRNGATAQTRFNLSEMRRGD